jgi:two-component system cell cycle response regulator
VPNSSNQRFVAVFDPDQDFLDAVLESSESRAELRVEVHLFTRDWKISLEEYVQNSSPDIIVLNLDQESRENFGVFVSQIRAIPLPLPPIILATTSNDTMEQKVEAYKRGVDDYLIRPFTIQDLWLRLNSLVNIRRLQFQLENATRKLSKLNRQLAESNQKLEELTVTDELTGLYNMRYMIRYLESHFEMLTRYERPFSIIMMDLDHFKQVNDKHDHLVGSAALKSIGKTMDNLLRVSDIKARYRGDEFIVALPETEPDAVAMVAERLRIAVSETPMVGLEEVRFKVTASIGVASFIRERHKTYRELIKDADRAMYNAKEQGRNRVVIFKNEQNQPYDESQSAVLATLNKFTATEKAKVGKR